MGWVCAALLAGMVSVTPASAQELSEKATRAFMEYAWSLTPEAFTKPNGETIQIDKTKKSEVLVPWMSRATSSARADFRHTLRSANSPRSRPTTTIR
jgi:hypothetical protein